MADDFSPNTVVTPASRAVAVTPSDSTALTYVSRALFVGVSGDLKVTTEGGDVVTFTSISAGWHPIRVRLVWSTGTTASAIVSVW